MSQLLSKSFALTRKSFVKKVSTLEEGILDIQPEGFNNTIHWHIGHVLTVTEQLLFGFPKKSTNLPANYLEFFATGTKPADWQGEIPSVQELVIQLRDQLDRINQIPGERFSEKLKTTFLGQETFGELANFSNFHEALHLGQIQSMDRVITAAKAN
ncbi:DinB family protein [Neobacillus jeddahensis]|uniref:DinB family protein n=1 Tax=Neobacillus jeddahensis TaxID=1461580 RepID=UPI00058EDD1E|nr:DinB family protein [Neobacillus jeddahensis]